MVNQECAAPHFCLSMIRCWMKMLKTVQYATRGIQNTIEVLQLYQVLHSVSSRSWRLLLKLKIALAPRITWRCFSLPSLDLILADQLQILQSWRHTSSGFSVLCLLSFGGCCFSPFTFSFSGPALIESVARVKSMKMMWPCLWVDGREILARTNRYARNIPDLPFSLLGLSFIHELMLLCQSSFLCPRQIVPRALQETHNFFHLRRK